MISAKQLANVLGDKTSVQIIRLLSEKEMTTTEVFNALSELRYRESAYKALMKLHQTGLIKRKFNEKIRGYKYSTKFKTIKINAKTEIKIE